MGYEHSITLPGISNAGVTKRVVTVVDGDREVELTLGKTDNIITFTANNLDISYSYVDHYEVSAPSAVETVQTVPELVAAPEIAPEAPTDLLLPVPPTFVEGDVVVAPASDL